MTAENHRFASAGQCEDEILHLATANRVQPRRRFIEDDEIRIVDERLRQPDAALHALGEFADRARARLRQSHHVQQLLRALLSFAGREVKEMPEEIQRLVRVEEAIQIRFLRQITDARLGGDVARRLAEDLNVAARGIEQAQEQLHRRGFPRAIRPEQSEHLALAHLEIHAIDRARLGPPPEILEDLGQAADGDDGFAGLRIADCGLRIGVSDQGCHASVASSDYEFAIRRNTPARSALFICFLATAIIAS